MAKPKQTSASERNTLPVDTDGKEPLGEAVARKINAPWTRHGIVITEMNGQLLGALPKDQKPNFSDFARDLKKRGETLGEGDLQLAGQLLASQAMTLDAIFSECARRSAVNMGEYIEASERYMRLALKAQANSRASLEALAKLHQPREQTVRHVHVNEGGQAVIADQVHNHTGGQRNAETDKQPHAPKSGAACESAALPCPDPIRPAVPRSGDQGSEAVPNARRQGKRRAKGQS